MRSGVRLCLLPPPPPPKKKRALNNAKAATRAVKPRMQSNHSSRLVGRPARAFGFGRMACGLGLGAWGLGFVGLGF